MTWGKLPGAASLLKPLVGKPDEDLDKAFKKGKSFDFSTSMKLIRRILSPSSCSVSKRLGFRFLATHMC